VAWYCIVCFGRSGQRTDLQPRLLGDEVKRTDEIAAKKAGFGSKDEYRRVTKVVDKGSVELNKKKVKEKQFWL